MLGEEVNYESDRSQLLNMFLMLVTSSRQLLVLTI